MQDVCAICRLPLASREGDTWAFMYISTAFITGLFVLAMLWILPNNLWMGRILIAATALGFFFLTWPFRKGAAIAFDYFVELRMEKKVGLKFRE
ncbi:MAG: DUF983 domain-containing protein [Deltaproteobacteria bacterium]|nr:DUF983 domain-containing protein [Deltaproteobacteria bacterium]